MQIIIAQTTKMEGMKMKCTHVLKVGGFMDRVSQYIQSPQLVTYGLDSDTAHAITRLYFSYL